MNENNEIEFITEDTEELEEIKSKEKRNWLKPALIIGSAVILVAVIGFFGFNHLMKKWNSGDIATPAFLINSSLFNDNFTYFDNVYVNNISLNNLTLEQAYDKVSAKQNDFVREYELKVTADGKNFKYTQKDFEYEFNTAAILEDAKQYCMDVRSGKLKKESRKDFTVTVSAEETSVKKTVKKIAKKVEKDPVNSTFKVNKSQGSFSYTKGEKGIVLNEVKLYKDMLEFINSDKTSGTVKSQIKKVNPKISSDELEENITKISSFSTISTNTAAGNTNMRVSLAACNGSIIEPGEIWSFNSCTGNSNLTSNGYVPATVISGGQLATGVGGGLCQSSTTIYNAALYANMRIVERHNHYWASTYCKAGFDASINYGSADLKLKNNTKYPMYMECYMSGNKLTVNIYGRKSKDFDKITLSAKQTSYKAKEYMTYDSFRILHKDGKVVKTEKLISSRYSLKPKNSTESGNTSSKPSSSKNQTSSKKKPSASSKPKPTSSKPSSSAPPSSAPSSTPQVSE